MDSKPIYEHDCEHCIYLGRHEHVPYPGIHPLRTKRPSELDGWEGTTYDLYVCPVGCGSDKKKMHPSTVVARFGNDGAAYKSSLLEGYHDGNEYSEAMDRAEALGFKPREAQGYMTADRYGQAWIRPYKRNNKLVSGHYRCLPGIKDGSRKMY
jgi:hypothetical protein